MTAAEARKRAEEIKAAKINTEMSDVMEDIEAAVREGKTETTYYKPLSQEIIDYLEITLLFKVKKQEDWRDGNYYEIEW